MKIYRRLAGTRFDAHAPDLALGLGGLSQIYLRKGQNREAVGALEEALAAIVPFFEKSPQVFWRLVKNLIADYVLACHAAGLKGNAGLMERIDAVIERAKAGAIGALPPEAEQERFASIQALYEKAREAGVLDEELLAKFSPEAAKQARTLWAALQDR